MSELFTVVEEILITRIISRKEFFPRKVMMDLGLNTLSIMMFLAGIFFLITSLNQYLNSLYSDNIASLILSVILLSIAFFIIFFVNFKKHEKAPNDELSRSDLYTLIETICNEFEEPIKNNPKLSMTITMIAGFIAAKRLE